MQPPQAAGRAGVNQPEFSVSELASAIRRALEGTFGYVRLRGEISGFRGVHTSGHCYFALKDDQAKIDAVIWRSVAQGLKVKPVEGLQVVATGRVTSYPSSSKYQIIVEALEPAGAGALMVVLAEECEKSGMGYTGLLAVNESHGLTAVYIGLYCAGKIWLWLMAKPPRSEVLWSPKMSYANPKRGSRFHHEGLSLLACGTFTRPVSPR